MLQSNKLTKVYKVKHTSVKIIGWLNILLFGFGAVGAWYANTPFGFVLIFVFAFLLGIYLVAASGDMEADLESIRFNQPFTKYRMNWDDIECVEFDQQFGNMVFFGKGKILNVIGPAAWSGKNEKQEMINFVFGRIEELGIELRQTQKAMFRLSKNTKV
jgi:hypothetical protein